MRMINWDRDLGCKCQHLHAVDWCGCSPMDFLSSDFERIQNESGVPTYFGRKFEAVVDQTIINKVDELVYGFPLPPETPGLNSFWLNEYHHKYLSTSDHPTLTFFYGFASLAVHRLNASCQLVFERLLEATTYMENDAFSGIIVTVEVLAASDYNQSVFMEFLLQPSFGFQLASVNSPVLQRLYEIEVGTNFDVKEQLFRNFAGLFGPTSNISVKLSFEPGNELSVILHVVSPSGTRSSQDIEVSVTDETYVVEQLNLNRPLASGIWTIHVAEKDAADSDVVSSVAEVKFLVVDSGSLHSTSGLTSFLTSLSAAWQLEGSCLDAVESDWNWNTTSCASHYSTCVQTQWSTRYPDPKSWFGMGN